MLLLVESADQSTHTSSIPDVGTGLGRVDFIVKRGGGGGWPSTISITNAFIDA